MPHLGVTLPLADYDMLPSETPKGVTNNLRVTYLFKVSFNVK